MRPERVVQDDRKVGGYFPNGSDRVEVKVPNKTDVQHAPRLIKKLQHHYVVQTEGRLDVIDISSNAGKLSVVVVIIQ